MAEERKQRVFVGIPFDNEAKRGIKKVFKKLNKKHWPVKWEKEEKLHITLAFLGWIKGSKQIESVSDAVESACIGVKSLGLEFKGLGSFPDLVLPRVIWVGLKGDLKELARLYKRVNSELIEEGFELEVRPFVPHVTLGRMKKEVRNKQRRVIGGEIGKLRRMDIPQKLAVDQVIVYESKLSPDGSEYRILKKVRLTNAQG